MIPVARNVWQHVEGGAPRPRRARLIIASTSRRSSARPVSRLPAGGHGLEERRLRLLEPACLDVGVEGRRGPSASVRLASAVETPRHEQREAVEAAVLDRATVALEGAVDPKLVISFGP